MTAGERTESGGMGVSTSSHMAFTLHSVSVPFLYRHDCQFFPNPTVSVYTSLLSSFSV